MRPYQILKNKIIQDADSVGTALKTTSLRLRGTSVDILNEEGLDSEGAVTSKSKLQSKVKALSGVDILTATGEYKSTYEILSQIADVWEDISNMDQAALLELISGKRNSSVIAAILQNPQELKEALEDANNAEGSALKENEKYLDSIQGKIDQFNNAIQTLWSNTLNSDTVKWFVDIATQLVKWLDKLGPIKTLLAGIFAYANKKYDLINFSGLFKNTKIAKAKLEELEAQRAKLGDPKSEKNRQKVDALDQEINKYKEMLRPNEDLLAAQNKLKAAQDRLANTKSTNPETLKKYQREVDAAKLKVNQLTTAQKTTGKTGKTAFSGLGASVQAFTKKLVSALAQMLIMWAIAKAIEVVTEYVDSLITTSEEAAEEFENLTSELKDFKNEIESINDELSTLDDKIAELTAKDSLTFTEKEELERLRAEREELERTLELNQQLANQKQQQVNSQTSDQVEYYKNKGTKTGKTAKENLHSSGSTGAGIGAAVGVVSGVGTAVLGAKAGTALGAWAGPVGMLIGAGIGAVAGGIIGAIVGGKKSASEETIGESIDNMEENLAEKEEAVEKARAKYQDSGSDKDKEKYEKAQQALSDYKGEMAKYFTDLDDYYKNVDLSTIEDPDEYKRLKKEMNDFYNERDKWLITSGAEGAESNSIERIFSKEDYESASDTIDELVEKLKKDPTNQSLITQISEQCQVATSDLEAVGLSTKDAIDYFTQLGQDAAFGTLEGKTKEISLATSKLKTLLSNTKSSDFTGLFGQGGEVSSTAIAEYFQGTSEATRTEISKLVKNINEGKMSVEQAMKSFTAFGMVESWKIVEAEVSELNTEVFKDIKDDISGVINTVKELSSAFEDVANSIDLVSQAEAEMAYSGHLSVETALKLMESTDDWNEVLEIENGNLKLAEGAEDALVQTKLDLIKTNIQTALSTVEAQLAQLNATSTNIDAATTIEESTNVAVRNLAGNMAYAAKMAEAYTRAMSGESVNIDEYVRAAEAAKTEVMEKTDYQSNAAKAIGRDELEKEKERLEAMLGIVKKADTREEFETNYYSDKVSGGSGTKEDAEENKFQESMDYWENRISANQAKYEQIQNEIDLLEAKGMRAGEEYYQEQIELENERKSLLEQQKAEALARLAAIEAAGNTGSDEWWETVEIINGIENDLDDVVASIVDIQDAIGETNAYLFEQTHDRISTLTDQLETVRNLLGDDSDWFDDNGDWTEKGTAALATYIQKLEIYKNALIEAEEEMVKYQGAYVGNEEYYANLGIHSEQEWYDKHVETRDMYNEYLEMIDDTENAVVDMYESQIDAIDEYIQTLIDGYNDYIDSVKDALSAEKDLYDFKRKIEDQSTDIAATERKIAALSGSTNAADIAERRRLEATLYDQKRDLEDSYRDHSIDSQQQALDDEQAAYEESMNKYIEGLRDMLEEAKDDMKTFLSEVTNVVVQNAGTVKDQYIDTGVALDSALVDPLTAAEEKMAGYEDGALARMNDWTKAGENGYFYNFDVNATDQLTSPWGAGSAAVDTFATNVATAMADVYNSIKTNVDDSLTELSSLDTNVKADKTKDTKNPTKPVGTKGDQFVTSGKSISTMTDFTWASLDGGKKYKDESTGKEYYKITSGAYKGYYLSTGNVWSDKRKATAYDGTKLFAKQYAKGTLGTSHDQWAITDESWIGEEITLAAGKNGQLQYLKKGSSVMPADISKNLVEWGKLNPDMLKVGGGANLNMISNAVVKPELNFAFDSLVHVDNCSQETLKDLEKMVDTKINQFSKQLNYAIKKYK